MKFTLSTFPFKCLKDRITWSLILFISAFSCTLRCEEEFIDLRTFVNQRTQRYPILIGSKIHLISPQRSGNMLIAHLLKFLFYDTSKQNSNSTVTQNHTFKLLEKDAVYLYLLRNPIDACISWYRLDVAIKKMPLPFSKLDNYISVYIKGMSFLEQLISLNANFLVLKYDEFVNDFDFLLNTIENKFRISIDVRDKCFLKKALSKENVLKNMARMKSLSDPAHGFYKYHIDQQEITEELKATLKVELLKRFSMYNLDSFKKWGYFLENSPLAQ